jgi:transposase
MLQITPKHKIFVAIQPIDFRCGIDGLAACCRSKWQLDPMTGHVFVFCNRKRTALKILAYDSQGYWLCHKRLSRGSFEYWPKSPHTVVNLGIAQLQALLYNANPGLIDAPVFKPLCQQ